MKTDQDYRPECVACHERWTPESEDSEERRCPKCVSRAIGWRPAHTAPFRKPVLFAVEDVRVPCIGMRKRGSKRAQQIGVLYADDAEWNEDTWIDDEGEERPESVVLGWMPLPELPTERVR